MKNSCLFIFIIVLLSCNGGTLKKSQPVSPTRINNNNTPALDIGQVPLPDGYERVKAIESSFAQWLRKLPFKKDRAVYLFNGSLKPNQKAQYAVLDISTGNKDLQQCADVVMRLRAEYLFFTKNFKQIWFTDYAGKKYQWSGGDERSKFNAYLENVFGWCGSASLEKQLQPVTDFSDMQIGDVFIKGGFPGHAVMVVDMAVNKQGEKMYMLVQGYQPAQDMHLLINPTDAQISPWYKLSNEENIYTPEWHFTKSQLRKWQLGN